MASVQLSARVREEILDAAVLIMRRKWYEYEMYTLRMAQDKGYTSDHEFAWDVVRSCLSEAHNNLIDILSDAAKKEKMLATSFGGATAQQRLRLPERAQGAASVNVVLKPERLGMCRDYYTGTIVRPDNPFIMDLLKLEHKHQEVQNEVYKFKSFLRSFLSYTNTGGQVRRDWPALLNHMPTHIMQKLGGTVARGRNGWMNDEDREYIALMDERMAVYSFYAGWDHTNPVFNF